jgi:acyl-coenzyme A thioesterase 9
MGKILEDMDALAGNIAFSHCDDNNPKTRPLSLVTASVEKIRLELQSEIAMGNIVLVGQVGWVGKSSLDIVVEIHKAEKTATGDNVDSSNIPLIDPDSRTRLLSSVFTYVARNKITGKSAAVNKLDVSNAPVIEKNFFNKREEIMKKRKSSTSSDGSAVNLDSKIALQALVDAGSATLDMPALAHVNAVLMRSTTLENSFICQPQHVNTAHKVFGGFLMRRAYDLASATAYTFAGKPAHLQEIDRINFKHPVEIGDLVRLKSKIVYSTNDPIKPSVVCEVICQIVRPEKFSSSVSNTFNFTFGFMDQVNPRKVLPSSMEEAEAILKYSANFTSPSSI